jgi:hypothetical protein
MAVFHFYISQQVAVPDDVMAEVTKRLKRYFDRVCQAMKPRTFTGSAFELDPHMGKVKDTDLLVYITSPGDASLIHEIAKRQGATVQGSGHGGGATVSFPEGVLSEAYWPNGLQSLHPVEKQGHALANFIFHEFAHNKHTSDPTALKGGESPRGLFVHNNCGFGVFGASVTTGAAANFELLDDNIAAMARVLGSANKQYPFGLFSDELGF